MKKKKEVIKKGDEEEIKILNRLSRIEGQIRGIRKMIEEKKGCTDIITQTNAVRQAITMLAAELLENEFICRFERGEKIKKEHLQKLFKLQN
ncbi:MAG: hypothetical protein UT48_C0003G0014 [Parcubacteria group bacterium GW2011_GWE2_39_37]|uniref:Uncharacterized protein n=1 Tax=Candidatus Falkowbacteria bacterium GW2011_GWF2_39_8 TaxID=1618642 RepID=A0A0G0T140_9BACT|nr:MAG: hypothetical protein UT48_C0003G0014 [Parcubacteria group bacterium GW2011_GWE2_39_37]KKR31577.1 MAG: hypothetical protein UT64_C0056G0002 [Candidatus Falkowbacteria bacterium GW2011_GWF2_39_8]